MIRYAPGVDPRLTPDEQEWQRFKVRWGAPDYTAGGWLPPAMTTVRNDTGRPIPVWAPPVWVP